MSIWQEVIQTSKLSFCVMSNWNLFLFFVVLCYIYCIQGFGIESRDGSYSNIKKMNCPCSNKSLCAPLTIPPRKEIYLFQVNSSNYESYDWNLVFFRNEIKKLINEL